MRVCSVSGCPDIYPTTEGSKCARHRKDADKARGTSTERGYNSPGHKAFRAEVLTRDPVCVLDCTNWATVADHYPLSRKELINQGLDPNDPQHGRGLCKTHHDQETAQHQPGGWNAP